MSTILAGLEGLVEKTEVPEIDIDSLIVDVMVANEELIEAEVDLQETEAIDNRAVEAVETLTHIRNMIAEHGISRPMMEIADPSGELAAAGLVEAYENLETSPVNDANAVAAIEGLGEMLKKAWDKIIAFVKEIVKRIKALFGKAVGLFKKQEVVLKALLKKMKDATVDADKAKDLKVKVLKGAAASDVRKAIDALETFASAAFDRAGNSKVTAGDEPLMDGSVKVASIAGILKVEEKKDEKNFNGTKIDEFTYDIKIELELEDKDLPKKADVEKEIKEALQTLAKVQTMTSIVTDNEKLANDMAKEAKVTETDEDKLKTIDKVLKSQKKAVSLGSKCTSYSASLAKITASAAISQARGILKAS